jgi:uncharacterized protein
VTALCGRASFARSILLAVILVVAAIGGAVAQPRFPALSGRVVDQANILSASTRARLTEILDAHEKKTSNQVVVVTLSSLQGYDIADFGVRLGRAWKLGQADRNNGAVLLVAPNERAVRIEVGYGLEGDLTDARSHAIIQNEILPRFRAGDIEGGIVQGTLAILGTIEGTYTAKPAPAAVPDWIGSILVPLLMFGIFAWIMMMHRRYGRSASSYSMVPPMIGGMGGFGGRRGGSFGGGSRPFGGGGGSFGGGGASGRW